MSEIPYATYRHQAENHARLIKSYWLDHGRPGIRVEVVPVETIGFTVKTNIGPMGYPPR